MKTEKDSAFAESFFYREKTPRGAPVLPHILLVLFWHLVKFIAYAADADDVVGVMIFTFQFFSQGADVDHDSFCVVFHAGGLPDCFKYLSGGEYLARMLDQQFEDLKLF